MNKDNYIKRETVIKHAKKIKNNFAPLHKLVIEAFISSLNDIPNEDVTSIKYGEWEPVEEEAYWIHNIEESLETGMPTKAIMPRCSCCKKVFGTIAFDFKYCPECGAKMKGKKND